MKIANALLLSLLALAGCGPGGTDGEFSISNGYALSDSGGNEKMIVYRKGNEHVKIVVDARVDNYVVDGQKIIAARRPAETVMRNGIADVKLSPTCEYWMIDIETHAVEQITDASKWPSVRCDMGKTYGAMVEKGAVAGAL
jgi:hypothetical protein